MIVGLTGGIGSGKTTVANFFRELGVPVYNSDVQARRLMRTSKELKKAIIELLGKNAYQGQKLNKKFISEKIFGDGSLLEKMNSIVHPAVREHFLVWKKKQEAPYVVQETALIFENGLQDSYDHIILVKAPENIRIRRVHDRDGISINEIQSRMKNQLTDEEKVPFADYVIDNTEISKTQKKVEKIHSSLLKYSE